MILLNASTLLHTPFLNSITGNSKSTFHTQPTPKLQKSEHLHPKLEDNTPTRLLFLSFFFP